MTLPRTKLGQTVGKLSERQMNEITRLVALWVGIAG
jgi:mRNA interferase MazF